MASRQSPVSPLWSEEADFTFLRFVDEVGSQGVAFHTTDHIERGLILLDGKIFEPPLINMAVAGGVAVNGASL